MLPAFVFWVLALSAFLTAFYTMRQISLTFLGKPRTQPPPSTRRIDWTMTAAAGRPGVVCHRRWLCRCARATFPVLGC